MIPARTNLALASACDCRDVSRSSGQPLDWFGFAKMTET
jgi:hypothetical protein